MQAVPLIRPGAQFTRSYQPDEEQETKRGSDEQESSVWEPNEVRLRQLEKSKLKRQIGGRRVITGRGNASRTREAAPTEEKASRRARGGAPGSRRSK